MPSVSEMGSVFAKNWTPFFEKSPQNIATVLWFLAHLHKKADFLDEIKHFKIILSFDI